MTLSLNGRLLLGLLYQGKPHFEVNVRILTLGDECNALEQIAELQLGEDNSAKAKTLRELAYLAQQIQVLGIPTEALTAQYLLDNLATDDYVLLLELIAELRKKRIAAGETQNPSSPASDNMIS